LFLGGGKLNSSKINNLITDLEKERNEITLDCHFKKRRIPVPHQSWRIPVTWLIGGCRVQEGWIQNDHIITTKKL
jgi:hypothetical protein